MDTSTEALRRLAAGTLMPGFVGTSLPSWIEQEYAAGLAAVCLYGANVVASEQLLELCGQLRALGEGVVVALDEEGGDVTRLHYLAGSPEPGNAVLGRLDDLALTRASAARIGRELARHGITLDLGPVVDVNSAAENPVIGVRSFGADPALVARHAAAWVAGLQATGVAACVKHFPGHGDTVADSHLALPLVGAPPAVLEARELVPFRAAIEAGAAAVMTSHIVVPALDADQPATFSPAILTDLLRGRLGFTGVIVSDALDMVGASGETGIPTAAVRALAAGCDLLCLGADTRPEEYRSVVAAVVAAVDEGRLPVERLTDAAARARTLAHPSKGQQASKGQQPSRGHQPTYDAHPGSVTKWPSDVAAPSTGDLPTKTIQRAFEISEAGRQWLEHDGPVAILQVDTASNLAVGGVPWGPRAVGAAVTPDTMLGVAKAAVVGRAVGPDHPARELAARLRTAGHRVILVECGWPSAPVDIATYGSSRAVAAALVDLLTTGGQPRRADR